MSGERPLTVALGKGRLLEGSLALLESLGFEMTPVRDAVRERRMIAHSPPLRLLLAKDADVPVYVEQGAADLGIAGRDVLRESDVDVLVPVALGDLLPAGRCRLALIAPRAGAARNWRLAPHLIIASKYPGVTRRYIEREGISGQVIGLSGSVELAPASGMADLIVDIVQSGTTLRENDLVELETLLECEACLIVNRASHKLRRREIRPIIDGLERRVAESAGQSPG